MNTFATLSVRQPWAWALFDAGKCIENRSRRDGKMLAICKHRGPLLIHAVKGCTRDEHAEAARWIRHIGKGSLSWPLGVPPVAALARDYAEAHGGLR